MMLSVVRAALRSPAAIHFIWMPFHAGWFGVEPARRVAIIARFGGKHVLDETVRLAPYRTDRLAIGWMVLVALATLAALPHLFNQ